MVQFKGHAQHGWSQVLGETEQIGRLQLLHATFEG